MHPIAHNRAPCVICNVAAGEPCKTDPGLQHAARMIPDTLLLLLMYDIPSLAKALTTVGCLLLLLSGCAPRAPQPPAPPTIAVTGDFK